MNRRQMLTLATGATFCGITASSIEAQQTTMPWIISEDELKTTIVLPKKNKKRIKTNRFEQSILRYDSLIKRAEAVCLADNKTTLNGEDEYAIPKNITPQIVNHYFNAAANYKGEGFCEYNIEVGEFTAIINEKDKCNIELGIGYKSERVLIVTLSLQYSGYCGVLCGFGFSGKKIVSLGQNADVTSLYMPYFMGYVS